jgi:hypothetical protein
MIMMLIEGMANTVAAQLHQRIDALIQKQPRRLLEHIDRMIARSCERMLAHACLYEWDELTQYEPEVANEWREALRAAVITRLTRVVR